MKRILDSLWIVFLPALSILPGVWSAAPAGAGEHAPFTARAGLDIAVDAARAWAPDARLVYLENDEVVTADGTAARWSYLFYSEQKGKARGYSVRGGEVLEAADLGFDFEAPPLPSDWIDSRPAYVAAEEKAGREYRLENDGRLEAMLLIRGALYDKEPDATTWAAVYTSPSQPALVVVVDATRGKVVRTWRG